MPEEVRLALEAMGTRFELVMDGADRVHLRAAGEEALAEIARLDRQLSLYNPASDISWINAHAARMPVVVEPCLFDLLDRCQRLSVVTEGAFDMTVGPLMQAWWSTQKEAAACGAVPDAVNLDAARQAVGFEHLRLVQHGAPSTSRDVAWRLISALPGRDTRSMRQSRSYETTVCRTR